LSGKNKQTSSSLLSRIRVSQAPGAFDNLTAAATAWIRAVGAWAKCPPGSAPPAAAAATEAAAGRKENTPPTLNVGPVPLPAKRLARLHAASSGRPLAPPPPAVALAAAAAAVTPPAPPSAETEAGSGEAGSGEGEEARAAKQAAAKTAKEVASLP
jgi:hypothetical protein